MSWLKISDDALSGPRMTALAREDRLLLVELLAWRNRNVTELVNDVIPERAFVWATDHAHPQEAVERLVAAGAMTVADGGWRLVWMVSDQMKVDEVVALRAANTARQERHRRHLADDHSRCDASRCRVLLAEARNGVTNAVTDNAAQRVTNESSDPTSPSPTTRKGRGRGARGERPSAEADAPARRSKSAPALADNGSYLPVEDGPAADPRRLEQEARELLADPSKPDHIRRGAARALAELVGAEAANAAYAAADPVAGVPCQDYLAHQLSHRRTGDGWTCDLCVPIARPQARPRPHPRLRPRSVPVVTP